MKDLAVSKAKTMSSEEISALVESRHDKVKQSIERLAARGVIELPPMGKVKNHLGQSVSVYMVGKRDSYVVVAQLCPEFTARLVDRWQELEAAQTPKLPCNYVEALEALLESEKQKAIMAPKAEFYDRIVERSSLMNATQVGQPIGLSAVKLNQHLSELGVYNRTVKRGKAFQQWFIDEGYGEMKQTEIGYPQALFTTSGQAWITEEFSLQGII